MNSELDQLADRHFRVDPQGVLEDGPLGTTGVVLIKADAAMARAPGVQHLVWMLVNLLCRQFKVVREIVLDLPLVALHAGVAPFGAKPDLAETLEECVRLVSGPHVGIRRAGAGVAPDIALMVGDGTANAPWHWRLYADGWRYFIGLDGEVPPSPRKAT